MTAGKNPLLVPLKEAARLVGLFDPITGKVFEKKFQAEVRAGLWPKPFVHSRPPRWRLADIEKVVNAFDINQPATSKSDQANDSFGI